MSELVWSYQGGLLDYNKHISKPSHKMHFSERPRIIGGRTDEERSVYSSGTCNNRMITLY